MTVHHLPKPIPDGDPNHQSRNFPVPGKSTLPSHSLQHSALREETSRWLRHQPPCPAGWWLPLSACGTYGINRCQSWGLLRRKGQEDKPFLRAFSLLLLAGHQPSSPCSTPSSFSFPTCPHLVLHFLPHILPSFIYHHPMCGTISFSPTNPSCLRRLLGLSSKTFLVCAPSISRPHQHLSHNLQHFSHCSRPRTSGNPASLRTGSGAHTHPRNLQNHTVPCI